MLALYANELVSTSRLVEAVWGEHPPATAEKLVHGYVHALRKRLGADVILTHGPGYKLDVGANGLDLQGFERLTAEGRDAPLRQAVELRRRALSLWRGLPLADVVLDGSAGVALARLEALRLNTQLEAVEGELELGRHAALVGELESLAATTRTRSVSTGSSSSASTGRDGRPRAVGLPGASPQARRRARAPAESGAA